MVNRDMVDVLMSADRTTPRGSAPAGPPAATRPRSRARSRSRGTERTAPPAAVVPPVAAAPPATAGTTDRTDAQGAAPAVPAEPAESPATVSLTTAEIAALALSLAHLGSGPQAATARLALRRLLEADDPHDDLVTATLATLTTPLDATTADRARTLAGAITERMVVRLHYRDAAGRVSVREVEPVTCLVHRDHWYLVAWCRLRHGIRAFRFDRVQAVEPTGVPARRHPADRFLPFQRGTRT